MKVFDAAATRAALPFDKLIPALRERFARGCTVPPRHVHELPVPRGAPVTSLIMPAWITGEFYGIKVVNVAPGNAARGLPGLHASYLLHDAHTGAPLALMDGDEITARRTAAASALAASYLARDDAGHLLVVGAGRVARLLPHAYREVRAIERVTVWARSGSSAEALAADWRRAGFNAAAATDLETATRGADIVSCATLSHTPLIEGRWLREGSHLDLIGSFTPLMREADDACFAAPAAVYVDTEEALAKSGDLLGPMARGVFNPAALRGTLTTLSRGESAGRRSLTGSLSGQTIERAIERTVFKSVGTALEDLAAAMLVWQSAGP